MTLKLDKKIWRKNDLLSFYQSAEKSQKSALWFVLSGNFWPKKVILHATREWCKIWRKTWEICQIFTRPLESLKIGTLMGLFYPKLKMYEFKIYMGVMFQDNEELCKNWRETDLSV